MNATRAQLQSITKMQIQMMDHMMHVWEEQIGKACTQMFGRKQRLVPKEWNERRSPAYDVPTAEAWQERLDARFGIQKKPPESPKSPK